MSKRINAAGSHHSGKPMYSPTIVGLTLPDDDPEPKYNSSQSRSSIMRAIKSVNTRPELKVRSFLHRAGYRFRLNARNLPGKPDLVLPSRRAVVFVHGCFWHGHSCKRGDRQPKTNATYWVAKISRNRDRDAQATEALREAGWHVYTLWECELNDPGALARLKRALVRLKIQKG
jgi:DNA mismatch endonuclease, patch repair protein